MFFMRKAFIGSALLLTAALPRASASSQIDEVPVFISIGQSNADGSAYFDVAIDRQLCAWYCSEANNRKMKIWYRSCQVQNRTSNLLGEAARWAVDGTITDVEPGWLDLWYRNENCEGRTAMNVIHSYGSYSTGGGVDCAQGRRGMEGEFGKKFCESFPESELYIVKLGVSGSFISSWANPADLTNWTYFLENIYKPAIADLLARGKRPRLAGIWWMQGCADHCQSQEYYEKWLRRLVERCRAELGFPNAKLYIGHIVAPGENSLYPDGSVQYGAGVRAAQDAVAVDTEGVVIIDTGNFTMQYEEAFNGYLHFDHAGQNAIGDALAEHVISSGKEEWDKFTTPGEWREANGTAVFTPIVGAPEINYTTNDGVVTATLVYPGFTEKITYILGRGEERVD